LFVSSFTVNIRSSFSTGPKATEVTAGFRSTQYKKEWECLKLDTASIPPKNFNVTSVTMIDSAEVLKHNSPKSCWLVLYGRVYDVTGMAPPICEKRVSAGTFLQNFSLLIRADRQLSLHMQDKMPQMNTIPSILRVR